MLIEVNNVTCRVSAYSQAEISVFIDLLTVTEEKEDYASGIRPTESFYWANPRGVYFYTGLILFVHNGLVQQKVDIRYRDFRTKPSGERLFPDFEKKLVPYSDQSDIVNVMLNKGRGVLDLATNYGKTYLLSEFWDRAGRLPMLVVVPTATLLHQVVEDLSKLLSIEPELIGKVGDGLEKWGKVTVGIIDSLSNKIKKYNKLPVDFDVLIVDEGHKGTSKRYVNLADNCNAFYRFWMSGTSYRDDTQNPKFHEFKLTGLAGPCIASVSNRQLVNWERSVKPYVRFIKNKLSVGNYENVYEEQEQYKQLKLDPARNELIAQCIQQGLGSGLTILTIVEHKDHVSALSNLTGVETEIVVGGRSQQNEVIRKRALEGNVKSVIATSAWREGVSIPCFDALIQAGGRRSKYNKMQYFGRILRTASDKKCGFYIDFTDQGVYFPEKQATRRLTSFQEERFLVEMVNPCDDIESLFSTEVKYNDPYQ